MQPWNSEQSQQTYNIASWSEGYFSVSTDGRLLANVSGNTDVIDLIKVTDHALAAGLQLPLLVRFPNILQHRVTSLCHAFDSVLKEGNHNAIYQPIYPIKVNQNKNVVEALLDSNTPRLGLEAGSKPELLTVLALSTPASVVVCNGYKDRDYIRLALAGTQMGLQLYIVIEKLSELSLVIEECKRSGTIPHIGIRLKLASIASGKWQSSGGERSKFGLTASQLLAAIEQLGTADMLPSLNLLHVHLGSQISNLRDIKNGMEETAQFLSQLAALGVNIKVIDAGGGLGVDYEGTRSRSECSVNYSLSDYATTIVNTLSHACNNFNLPMPDIFTESGRALTAHHALLITNVTEVEKHSSRLPATTNDESDILTDMRVLEAELKKGKPAREIYHDLNSIMQSLQTNFTQGKCSLTERALAEQMKINICHALYNDIDVTIQTLHPLRNELEEILADKVFCNFSLFQSMPDVWAIDQVFPIVPLQRLNEKPEHRAIIHDLTCDSDGRIDLYVDQHGVENTLPIHNISADERYLIGFFMLGAYQETLGDIHNLFGDTASVDVALDETGSIVLKNIFQGENISQLLQQVAYDPEQIREQILQRAQSCELTAHNRADLVEELQASLSAYSYLVD